MAGPNGSGKTTIFRTILGFLPVIERLAGAQLRAQRVRLRAAEFRAGLDLSDHRARSGGDGRLWPAEALSGIAGTRKTASCTMCSNRSGYLIWRAASFFSLSGGQRQRMLIARALMVGPKILILDEPLSGVDPESQKAISELLLKLNREEGKAIFFSSHDLRMVRSVTDKILRVDGGRVVWEEGSVAQHPW